MSSWSWCAGRPSLLCRCRSHGTQSCAPATRIVSPSTTPFAGRNKTQHRWFCSRHMFYFKQSSLPGHLQTASARTSLTMTMWSFAPTITSQPTMVRWEHWQVPERGIWSSGRQFDVYIKLNKIKSWHFYWTDSRRNLHIATHKLSLCSQTASSSQTVST